MPATGGTRDDAWGGGVDEGGLVSKEGALQDHQPDGVSFESTAGVHEAKVPHFHKAVGEDMLEEPTEKRHSIEAHGASTCTAGFAVGEGNGPVRKRDDTAIGDCHFEDIRGEVFQGGMGVWSGLAVDVPGDGPNLWVDVLQQSGLAHGFFDDGSVDGREGFHGDKDVGSGGAPCRAVHCEATAGHNVMDVGVVLERSSPGMQDPEKTREIGPDETRVLGEPFECLRRGFAHRVVSEALMRADKGTQGLRDGEGEEEVRSGPLLLQVVV